MRKRFSGASRWVAGAALVAALALAATPAMADQGRGRWRKPAVQREYRQDNRGGRGNANQWRGNQGQWRQGRRPDTTYQWRWNRPDYRWRGDARYRQAYRPPVRIVLRPQVVYRYEPIRRHTLPFPVWCAPRSRVVYYEDQPFFFDASLGVFFSGAQFWLNIGNTPPQGYVFYDPYSSDVYYSIDDYRDHCRGVDHPLLIQVISEDQAYGQYGGGYSGNGGYYGNGGDNDDDD